MTKFSIILNYYYQKTKNFATPIFILYTIVEENYFYKKSRWLYYQQIVKTSEQNQSICCFGDISKFLSNFFAKNGKKMVSLVKTGMWFDY